MGFIDHGNVVKEYFQNYLTPLTFCFLTGQGKKCLYREIYILFGTILGFYGLRKHKVSLFFFLHKNTIRLMRQ